jgi:hypothetical protein
LVRAFLEEAIRRGLRAVNLTTDEENNEKVNHFYLKLGFSRSKSFQTPEGRRMYEYKILLEDAEGVPNG